MSDPSVLHLDVLAALLLQDHTWVYAPHRVEALGLQHFEINGNLLPLVIERLVGVVTVD